MNKWNIIGDRYYIDFIQKNSKYFKQVLGQSITVEKNNNKELREGNFTTWYYNNYKAIIFKQGEIGGLQFYIDYYLKKDILGFFMDGQLETHQYATEWDEDLIKEVGIDSWLGKKLKEIDETIEENNEKKTKINTEVGDASKLTLNPGATTWADIKEYYQSKKK